MRPQPLLFAALMLSMTPGCYSLSKALADNEVHGETEIVHALPADLSSYKTLGFKVTSDVGAADDELKLLREKVVTGLAGAKEFEQVFDLDAAPATQVGLVLHFKLSALKRVSSGDRFWTGALAGQPMVVGALTLTAVDTGEVIGAGVVSARVESNNARAGTTEDAVARAATEIVRFLRK